MKRAASHFLNVIAVCLIAATAAPLLGQGRIVIEPPHPRPHPHPRPRPLPRPARDVPLQLKYLNINAEITDGVAVTAVKQSFHNQSGRTIEGTYVFPLPDNAVVGSFQMAINGQQMHGEVLDVETARKIYERIVAGLRDPGLLEFLGSRLYRVQVFPIPPGGRLDVELQYSQTLRESAGLGLFQHPLRLATEQHHPIEQLVIQARVRSQLPLTSVFCPSHKCEILRPNDREATVTFEQSNVQPDTDFQLYYQRTEAMFGVSLLTHRAAAESGYFLLRVSPSIDIPADQIQPKDIAFVIDTSGSMRGDKMEQARQALKFCINSLHARDRFNIYAFSTEVHPFRDDLVPADGEVLAAATGFAGKLRGVGGTNINQALLAALQADPGDDGRPYLIVFMTDGEPTVDVTDPDQILRNVKDRNSRSVRFHVLGVGTEVNTHLLDKLAEMNRGTREYCVEKENLELKLSALVTRLASPVLTDLTLQIAGLQTFDICPQTLPDLFRGGDVVVLGRYEGSGQHAIELNGRLLGATRTFTYEGVFPHRSAENDFLPRLWANRRIAYLLDQIRLHGRNQELVDEVVRLAKRHGIVTPYTSALIVEDDERLAAGEFAPRPAAAERPLIAGLRRHAGGRAGGGVVGGGRGGAIARKMAATTGPEAVDASRDLREAIEADVIDVDGYGVPQLEVDGRRIVRHVAEKTFVFDGQRWVDTAWNGEKPPDKVTTFSDEYFNLVKQHPRLARFFALGERVLVVLDGQVYETVPETGDEDHP